ncbi:MAG: hypothetical protein IPK35_18060 [Saprospiraceae bacterium]|jgi:hypothetical protein|nr:hypothetical protein [Saprospiraceae bacterium]
MSAAKPLTNLQMQLLKSFNFEIPESQLDEIKVLLGNYFASKATDEMDRLWEENDWSDETMTQLTGEHLRIEQ